MPTRSQLHSIRHFGFDARGRTGYMLGEKSFLTDQQQFDAATAAGYSPTPLGPDVTAPTVIGSGIPDPGTYNTGQFLDFQIVMSEPVVVAGGTPSLALTVGVTARTATYLSGSGTATLVFRHTVQSGDVDANGIAVSNTVSLNGATVRDAAANNANFAALSFASTAGVNVNGAGAPGAINGTGNITLGTILLAATGTVSGGAPASAPDFPSIAGSTVEWDIDMGDATLGALTTKGLRAGAATGVQIAVGGGAPTFITLGNGRKALDFNGTTDWAAFTGTNWFSQFNSGGGNMDKPWTLVVVYRTDANATQGIFGMTKGTSSGSSTVNRYDLFETATSLIARKANTAADQANSTVAGAPALTTTRIAIWSINGNPSANRGTLTINGSVFNDATADCIMSTTPDFSTTATVGARMIDANGTTRSAFLNGQIERIGAYGTALSDADSTTVWNALNAYYT